MKSKTIIYPTDFSTCAENAFDYTVAMAKALEGIIKTVHFIDVSDTITSDENPVKIMKELEILEAKAKRRLKARNKEILDSGIDCQYKILKSDRFSWLTNYISEQKPDLVVMGTQGANATENKILGSETYKVIKSSSSPILAVPEMAVFNGLKRIIFATDYQKSDIDHLELIAKIASYYDAVIDVVHVAQKDFDDSEYHRNVHDLKSQIFARVSYRNIDFKLLHATNVAERIEILLKESGADLLVLVTKKSSFFDRLFNKSLTKRMVYHTHTPMLIF